MSQAPSESEERFTGPWMLVLCLVGLDYFSSLAYLPSLVTSAVGPLAPLAVLVVVVVTLGVALPLYSYVVGRSPDGLGGTGLIERLVPGWRGKLVVLLLLSFVAADYIVTQNLSIADAAEHLQSNPHFERVAAPFLQKYVRPTDWCAHPLWQWAASRVDTHLLLTLLVTLICFALWAYWRSGSTRRFLAFAAFVVAGYMTLNAVVILGGVIHLAGAGRHLFEAWRASATASIDGGMALGNASFVSRAVCLGLAMFPFAVLGLSGFELSMAVAPMVRGRPEDTPEAPRGRIRNMRKLLVTATVLMSLWLFGAVLVTAVLVPHQALLKDGAAVHRALAYLAHGGTLVDGTSFTVASPIFGETFGTVYDAFTIAILSMAGACVLIALRDYVPDYLQRFGMELEFAHRLGVKMRFFNIIVLLTAVVFHADIARLQWAYVTSVLALLAGGAYAAWLSVRRENLKPWVRSLVRPLATGAFTFFVAMALLSAGISVSGLEIALFFAAGIVLTSAFSRWVRSTELRFHGFDFVDESSRHAWEKCCGFDFQILVPHRPGLHSRDEKVKVIRERHRLGPDVPIILVEAELFDPSDFFHKPRLRVTNESGMLLIQAKRCSSIAHVLAALSIELARVGRPPELHFGWSDESPMAANLNFLLFGEGNIPWMVRELIRKAEPDVDRRPLVILG
ncbi:MAG: hypothetical protein IT428_23505 [Planctomycetaceae bacterium]|nr:hypothetical protein [Planctomycetaceae bacterium]